MAFAGPRSQSLDLFSTPGPTDGDPMNSAMLGNRTREASLHLTSDTMTPCNRTRALPGAQSTSSHVGNAPVDASLPESNRMDTDRTLSDEETAVNDEEGWTPYTRRKPQRKIEPSQLRTERISRPHYILSIRPLNKTHVHNIPKQAITTALELTARNWQISNLALYRYDPVANCVKVTVRDEQHADKLSKVTTLTGKTQGKERTYAVQIERMPDRRPKGSKGVIKVRPDQSLDYIMDHLRCETATILDAKRLGKSDMLLITFDTEKPPYKIVFDYELVRVYDYRPKHIVCFNCHGLDHIAKHCPEDSVCRDCGRPQHPPDPDCIGDLFCVACQKPGHISLNSACPSRLIQAPPEATTRNENSKAVTWATVAKSKTTSDQTKPQVNEYQRQIDELRRENQQLRIKLEQLAMQLSTQSSVSGEIVTETTSSTTQRKPRSRTRTPRARSSTPKRRPMPKVSMPSNDMSIAQILGILRQERHTESRKLESSFREELTTLTTTFHETLEAVMTELRQITQRDDVKRRKLPTEGK
ncbi:hypothetical protein HPB47_007114 [Ixodes persulcatus]|uniref:Uncharacterized protein n=2 Tax=Ixodes persulcatus TaxID=34615 RepID=A0AC60P8N8_IXOPE|nr:hypothetical protein HPB47_012025 [Ixodes persulcatus]KAG0415716.1 hypothetical protein HPB47_007114 [Ixodes persulcatus]